MMRYLPRWLESSLAAPATRGKVRLVFGARQTGKSTLLRRVAGKDAVVVNLQDPRERLRHERQPGLLAQRLEGLEPLEPPRRSRSSSSSASSRSHARSVLIDEIQKVPALLEEVQYLHDKHRGRFEFFVTGSSARKLRTSSANLLPGRSHVFDLLPLVASERRGATTARVLPLPLTRGQQAGFRKARLEDVLLHGDLPGVVKETPAARRRTLEAYSATYLQEEIRNEAIVRNVGAFAEFLRLAARESGGLVNIAALSRATGIPSSTLKLHYQVLVDTFVGYWIPAFGTARGAVQHTPRFVFYDLGVRNATTGWRVGRSLLEHQGGSMLEQWVQLQLLRRCRYLGAGHRVSHWRTRHGREVDVVLETPTEVVPVEVKWTDSPSARDARNVEHFLDEFPRRAQRGFVVCTAPEAQRLSKRVLAIPWQET